jgi:LAO/AO transport system kinase
VTGEGITECWDMLLKFREESLSSGYFLQRRSAQNTLRMWSFVEEHLQDSFKSSAAVLAKRGQIEKTVSDGIITPISGALLLIDAFLDSRIRR